MVDRFFLFSSPIIRQDNSYQDQSHRMLLLSGPPSSGKTSLLFQFAYNSLLENNSTNAKVVFICSRRRMENNPPYLSQGIDPSSDLFQRVEIKYVEDDEGIKKYFSAFHLHDKFPLSVVVDDFGDFFGESNRGEKYSNPRGRDLAMVRVLALCQSAISHANKIGPCTLLLSDTCHGDSPRLLFIYKRWISSIFMIKGDGYGSFILHKYIHSISSQSMRIPSARFLIAL
ncbi:uncharacterized protein LOC124941706 isoform X2 [Impatiens glandulifera]|uniref:uncharacterized protein LOC124941706 isoform X2 n=1 Tax=Impatiens glandulifera TaxID=253017 RepID=UPI001FB17671|nr:uncharacterized protein LOC124941706 isoform X2 [Impatiens glandulifera]